MSRIFSRFLARFRNMILIRVDANAANHRFSHCLEHTYLKNHTSKSVEINLNHLKQVEFLHFFRFRRLRLSPEGEER